MRLHTRNSFYLGLFLLLLFPASAFSVSAITCHCFTERSYDPARPTMADPYFLATTQNSFFALAFKTDKRNIVMKKQHGALSDDLWIAYWVAAAKTGISPETLLRSKQDKQTWKKVIAPLRLSTKALGGNFTNALNSNSSSSLLAEKVVDELFLRFKLLDERELAAIRQAGASNQELIISTVIAAKTSKSAKLIYLDVRSGAKTWGYLLQDAKIDTKNMQQEISGIVRTAP